MNTTAYDLASRFVGIKEVPGAAANPAILAMLNLDEKWPADDSVAWCSAFVNYIAWLLGLPRSRSLRARSWLNVGVPVGLDDARAEYDVVILNRAGGPANPSIIDAPGHVGFFAGTEDGVVLRPAGQSKILVLGGNQHDSVSLSLFPRADVLGVRRLFADR